MAVPPSTRGKLFRFVILQVMKARTIPIYKLNKLPGHALELSGAWMEAQGGVEQGYEQLRTPSAHTSDGDVWRCAHCAL